MNSDEETDEETDEEEAKLLEEAEKMAMWADDERKRVKEHGP